MPYQDNAGDKVAWALTYVVIYSNMANFNETRAQALKKGPIIPVEAK